MLGSVILNKRIVNVMWNDPTSVVVWVPVNRAPPARALILMYGRYIC